ncbi:MAG: hypothetical protein ACI4TC_06590, partial [Kiritimatiellia bacterium]
TGVVSRREVTPGTSPALYCGTLMVPSPPSSPSPTFATFASFPADTFLDMTTWTKGIVCVYYPALVNADGCDGFTISGEGVIDGHGAGIWEEFWAKRADQQGRRRVFRTDGPPFREQRAEICLVVVV